MVRTRSLALAAPLTAMIALAGCQPQPRVVIDQLPAEPILSASVRPVTKAPAREPPAAVDAPASWIPPAYARPWQWIVVHHSASDGGSAEIFDRMHRARGWDELGYHFVVTNGRGGTDGQVQVGRRWIKQKWGAHCGGTPNNDYNNYGIGICLVGNFCQKRPSPAQLRALTKLTLFLCGRYGIHPSRVIGHRDAPNAATKCPGDVLHGYLETNLRPALRRGGQRASR